MDYKKIYENFIADRRIKEVSLTGYSEKHHIIPRSLGGSDFPDNLIKLSAGDHFFAHLLLAKIYGGKMWAAVWALASMNNNVMKRNRCRKYALLQRKWIAKVREEYAQSARGINNGKADKTVYNWMNVVTGEKISATRHDMPITSSQIKDYLIGKCAFAGAVWFDTSKMTYKQALEKYSKTNRSAIAKKASLAAIEFNCGEKNVNARAVKCLETGVIYKTITMAADATGANKLKIGEVCRGSRKSSGGFTWAYA